MRWFYILIFYFERHPSSRKKKKATQYYLYIDSLFLLVRKRCRENSIHMDSWVIIKFPGYLFFNTCFHFFILKIARPSPPQPRPFHLQFMLQFVDFVDVAVCIFSGPSGCGWDYKHLWFMVSQCSLTEMAFFLHPSYSVPLAVFVLFCFVFYLSSTQVWL